VIDENVVIEANTSIFPNTHIGAGAIIRSGAQIGSTALHVNKSPSGQLITTKHFGRTIIGKEVEIGNNSVVDRALFEYEETFIGDFTKIGSLVNISHGVSIGTNNRIAAGAQICGYTRLGDDNWVGPGVIISHMVNVGSECYLSLGSFILHDIEDSWKVVGTKIFKDRKLF
jgi:UDP-3-O-[3-hydroxymyristoyl] glucosamine N-acyltransferase